jgi:molybdopterin synthase catalytic subunit
METSPVPVPRRRVRVTSDPIDAGSLVEEVADPRSGATALFLGTVRDHSAGKTGVTHLDYEVYESQVEASIGTLVDQAAARWPLNAVVVEHRSGRVDLGGVSVAVAVSSAHRGDAFAAAQHLIDELKAEAPIWKKEFWPGGAEWSRGS